MENWSLSNLMNKPEIKAHNFVVGRDSEDGLETSSHKSLPSPPPPKTQMKHQFLWKQIPIQQGGITLLASNEVTGLNLNSVKLGCKLFIHGKHIRWCWGEKKIIKNSIHDDKGILTQFLLLRIWRSDVTSIAKWFEKFLCKATKLAVVRRE